MMSRKTWICTFLTVLTVVCLLVGCSDEPDIQDTSSVAVSGESSVSADESLALSKQESSDSSSVDSSDEASSEQASGDEASSAVSDEVSSESDESDPEESSKPETSKPETSKPETSKPETSKPETSKPETSKPETSKPETSKPETSKPETSKPETSKPETSKPETSKPETSKPETSKPETSKPETSKPETSKPEISEPDESEEPDISVPEVSKPEDSSEPEISQPDPNMPEVGSGTEEDPYLMIPDGETLTLTTIKIGGGSSVFYGIQRIGGKDLVIYDPDVYIKYEGKRYEAVEGVLTMRFETALASDFITIEIGNSGGTDKAFLMQFADPKGSQGNPEIVDLSAGNYSVSLEAEDSDGYYYRYKADKNGKIRFSMTASVDSVMTVTNNRSLAQRGTDSDGAADANGWLYLEIDVQAGDELVIVVGAVPNRRGKYPATDITWKAEYVA